MNVLLLHLDGKLPNIALMRVAAHHRSLGDTVTLKRVGNKGRLASIEWLLGDEFERVYASAIFDLTKPLVQRVLELRPDAIVGGTGVDVARSLEDFGITTKEQDYGVYPDFRESIGFSQRGCRLKCEFCVVPRKEGAARPEQSVAGIWRGDGHPRDLVLLDNDFFGVPDWREKIAEMRAGKFRVCFCQGINARMISDEAAQAIASVDYRDTRFKAKRIYTAWDNRKDESVLFRGLERLKAAGVKPDHVMVYMLIGFWAGETHADREHRRRRLREWGARPYPMPYRSPEFPLSTLELNGYARWVIRRADVMGVTWEEFERAKYRPEKLGDRHVAQRHLPLADVAE